MGVGGGGAGSGVGKGGSQGYGEGGTGREGGEGVIIEKLYRDKCPAAEVSTRSGTRKE